jgi:2,3-dimethylmalate lyase
MRKTTQLRALINAKEILVLPGVYDALSARIAERVGHKAITIGGYAMTGSLLAEPDSSQLSLTEMSDHYARVCAAVEVPCLVDGDTGFGNVTNVRRTVREFERAGVAGLFIEDQVFPKRCGHTPGKDVIPTVEMIAKIKAAADARVDQDLVIMARTDAIAINGLDDAIERANLYREAGADLLFIEAPRSVDDMKRICREGAFPQLANMISFGLTPELTARELQDIGYAAAAWPVASVFAVTRTLESLMKRLLIEGKTSGAKDEMVMFDDFTTLMGLPQLREREQHYLDAAAAAVKKSKSSPSAH